MTSTPKKVIIEVGTGVERYVDLTPEEIQQRELDAIAAATEKAEREAEETRIANLKASAKAKLVAGQRLTAEEADTLIL